MLTSHYIKLVIGHLAQALIYAVPCGVLYKGVSALKLAGNQHSRSTTDSKGVPSLHPAGDLDSFPELNLDLADRPLYVFASCLLTKLPDQLHRPYFSLNTGVHEYIKKGLRPFIASSFQLSQLSPPEKLKISKDNKYCYIIEVKLQQL